MKNKNVISAVLAGVLTVGAVAGLTGFTSKDTEVATTFASESEAGDTVTLTTVSDDSVTEESTTNDSSSSTLTVAEVAAKALPSVVTITNTSVTELESMYGNYGYYFGYGYG
ncbi:MAG: hypothetical protein LUH53_08555, partial [Lachnospiraceae bacterium]|nr:hypothetical protein [Lachnospiraceae bacterium]